jgi:hypothetical protein
MKLTITADGREPATAEVPTPAPTPPRFFVQEPAGMPTGPYLVDNDTGDYLALDRPEGRQRLVKLLNSLCPAPEPEPLDVMVSVNGGGVKGEVVTLKPRERVYAIGACVADRADGVSFNAASPLDANNIAAWMNSLAPSLAPRRTCRWVLTQECQGYLTCCPGRFFAGVVLSWNRCPHCGARIEAESR